MWPFCQPGEIGRAAAIDGRDCDGVSHWGGTAAVAWIQGYAEGLEERLWSDLEWAQKNRPDDGAA